MEVALGPILAPLFCMGIAPRPHFFLSVPTLLVGHCSLASETFSEISVYLWVSNISTQRYNAALLIYVGPTQRPIDRVFNVLDKLVGEQDKCVTL